MYLLFKKSENLCIFIRLIIQISVTTIFSISLILISSFAASSLNVLQGSASLIVNFWVKDLKTFKALTYFLLLLLFFNCFYLFFKSFTKGRICKLGFFYCSTLIRWQYLFTWKIFIFINVT